MNRFGSAPDGSKGKACKNMRVLYLLRSFSTLLEQEFDLLLKAIGVSSDLSQLLALKILQPYAPPPRHIR